MPSRENKTIAYFKRKYRKIFIKNKKKRKPGNLFVYLKKNPRTFWVIFLIVGFIFGVLFAGILPKVFATESVSILKTYDSDFDQGTRSGTIVGGSGSDGHVRLDGPPYPASGTWISPSSTGIIDLVFNGGWGDGTDDSTAFEAHLAEIGSNTSVKFEMRVAETTIALATADWEDLGTATETTFIKTRGELTALGLEEGTKRYVQVRATLYSTDGVTTPRLSDFKISYLKDNDPPTMSPFLMAVKNEQGGAINLVSDTWYNYQHPYFEGGAIDNCDPNPGCASGVTPCCSGLKGLWVYFGPNDTADPLGPGEYRTNLLVPQNYFSANLTSTGTYYLRMRTYDLENNMLSAGAVTTVFTYKYDATPPIAPGYISAPIGFIATKQFTFAWPTPPGVDSAADSDSGLAGYQYKLNNCPWYGPNHLEEDNPARDSDLFAPNIGSYGTTSETYDSLCLGQGINYIYLRSKDNAGNFSSRIVEGVVRINTEAPSKPQNLKAEPLSSIDNAFSFSWSAPQSQPAPIIAYRYSINILPSASNTSLTTQTSLAIGPYATIKGVNTFYVVAVAEGEVVNYTDYALVEFNCDALAPGIPKNLDIFDNSIRETKNYKIGLTWDLPDQPGTGFMGYKIYRSETDGASCQVSMDSFTQIATTTGNAQIDSSLQSKRYYYCIVAYNNTNQESAPSSTISLVPTGKWKTSPTLTKKPDATASIRIATITWSTDREANSFLKYGTKSQTYGSEVGSSDNVINHSVSLSGLNPNTTYYYKALWTDEDGNQGTSDEYSFTTGPAPTISNVSVSDISLSSAYVSFTVKNAVQVKAYYGKTTMYGGALTVATSKRESSYTTRLFDLDDDTTYHYMVELYDEEGNKYQFEDHSFKTFPQPRTFDIQIQQLLDKSSPTLKIYYNSNTEISTIVNYYEEKNPNSVKEVSDQKFLKNHEIEISNLNDNTLYILNIKGYDKFGNEAISDPQRVTTATDTRPPKISNVFVESKIKGQGSESEAQIIVSWKTDEASTSQVAFGQGASENYTNYTIQDTNMTMDHVVSLTGLKSASIYHLAAISYDVARNKIISQDQSVFTPRATESALDLIIKSLKEIFNR